MKEDFAKDIGKFPLRPYMNDERFLIKKELEIYNRLIINDELKGMEDNLIDSIKKNIKFI